MCIHKNAICLEVLAFQHVQLCSEYRMRKKALQIRDKTFNLLWCCVALDESIDISSRLQTTQTTSGGADTEVLASCCGNCVETSRPQQWSPDLPFWGKPEPMGGWRCSS